MKLPRKFIVCVHLASWSTKLWPADNWRELIDLAVNAGFDVVMPSGNKEEELRSQQLARGHSGVHALPRLPLSEVGWIINQAQGVVSCDTGLCHLAAALNKPTVSFYGPTDVKLIGATGAQQAHIIAKAFSCAPCYQKKCTYNHPASSEAACMRAMQPSIVWQQLTMLLRNTPTI